MPLKNAARVIFDFAEGYGFKSTCTFKAERKSAYTAEQVEQFKF